MDNPILAVIIVTKNRADALAQYALPSLAASDFRDFVCVVWDASDGDASRLVVERERERERAFFVARVRQGSSRWSALSAQRRGGLRPV